jgi:hypothetical protein
MSKKSKKAVRIRRNLKYSRKRSKVVKKRRVQKRSKTLRRNKTMRYKLKKNNSKFRGGNLGWKPFARILSPCTIHHHNENIHHKLYNIFCNMSSSRTEFYPIIGKITQSLGIRPPREFSMLDVILIALKLSIEGRNDEAIDIISNVIYYYDKDRSRFEGEYGVFYQELEELLHSRDKVVHKTDNGMIAYVQKLLPEYIHSGSKPAATILNPFTRELIENLLDTSFYFGRHKYRGYLDDFDIY